MSNAFPVPQEAVEAGLLAGIGNSLDHFLAIEGSGITEEDFSSHRQVWIFIKQHLTQYGKLPSANQLSTRFGWNPPLGEFAYWLDEMKRYSLAAKTMSAMQNGFKDLQGGTHPYQVVSDLVSRLSMIRASQTNHIEAFEQGMQTRLEKYRLRQQYLWTSERPAGIPTSLYIIDNTKQGWMRGELIGVYARPGVGKSWFLVWQTAQAWFAGSRVLLISPEMPASGIGMRGDVILGDLYNLPLEYDKVFQGDPSQEANYLAVAQAVQGSERWWTYDSLDGHDIGLGDVAALIQRHKPDFLAIDGISLLRPGQRGHAVWEQMKEISYGLKNLATISDIPIMITHQAVNSARGRRTELGSSSIGRGDDFVMPSLNDAAYGDAFVQACSTIITMVADINTKYVRWYSIRKARERGWDKDMPNRMALAWDVNRGKIYDLSQLGEAQEQITERLRQLLGYDRIG